MENYDCIFCKNDHKIGHENKNQKIKNLRRDNSHENEIYIFRFIVWFKFFITVLFCLFLTFALILL